MKDKVFDTMQRLLAAQDALYAIAEDYQHEFGTKHMANEITGMATQVANIVADFAEMYSLSWVGLNDGSYEITTE